MSRATRTPAPAPDGSAEGDVPVAEPVTLRTDAQSKRLFATLHEAGLTERDAVLAWLSELLDRDVTSTKTLTVSEASAAIDVLGSQPPEVTS